MTTIQPDLLYDESDFPVEFGRYTLLGLLGEGGMARVFRAELQGPEGFRKKAAIKIVRAAIAAGNANLGKALVNEARLGGLLHHPNVVDTYEYGVVDRLPFIAMEYVRGVGLDELLEGKVALEPAQVLDIGAQICAGLDHAHNLEDAGIDTELVHRDLKPSNILLSRDGLVKVMDFGIAKAASLSTDLTQTGTTKGTPAYMSPEQVAGDSLDRRSDLFAFGSILYELALGKRMFGGDSLMTILAAVLQVEERLKSSDSAARLDAVVPGLAEIVVCCMRKDRANRYSEAAEVEDALKALLRGQEASTSLRDFVRAQMASRGPASPGGSMLLSGEELAPTLPTPELGLAAGLVSGASASEIGPTVQQQGYQAPTSESSPPSAEVGATVQQKGYGASAPASVPPTRTPSSQPIGAVAGSPIPPTPAVGTPTQPSGTLWASPQARRTTMQLLLLGLGVGLFLSLLLGGTAAIVWKISRSADSTVKTTVTGEDALDDLGDLDSFPMNSGDDPASGSASTSDTKPQPVKKSSSGRSASDAGIAAARERQPSKAAGSSSSSGRGKKSDVPAGESAARAKKAAAGSAGSALPKSSPVDLSSAVVRKAQHPSKPSKSTSSGAEPMREQSPPEGRPRFLHMSGLKATVTKQTEEGTRVRVQGQVVGGTNADVVLHYNPPRASWLKRSVKCTSNGWCSASFTLKDVTKGRMIYSVQVTATGSDGQQKRWKSEDKDLRIQ